ncbi:hypothetical protein C0992_001044 [Termitomyces sp. T32_za158]|nr:hypothetical protein C0992_001044 [Termitomyces sp. T32_za158]
MCKPGEVPSVHRNHHKNKGSHHNHGTVTVFHKGSSTPCYAAPTGVPAGGKSASMHKNKPHHEDHKGAGGLPAGLSPPMGTGNQASSSGDSDQRALVKRTVDLLERYFNDLDELD